MEIYDIVSIGEMLVDFLPEGDEVGKLRFVGNPGGAPANVAVGASRLGLRSAFLGKVGDDIFGAHLKGVLVREGVDAGGLVMDKAARTTLAFVSLDSSGDRSFTFYRNPGADGLLREDELDLKALRSCRALVHGSISLIGEPSRSATLAAIKAAKEAGAAICFDPNLRESLWPGIDAAKKAIFGAISFSDLVKVSDDELMRLTGAASVEEGIAKLRKQSGADTAIAVSMGSSGAMVSAGGGTVYSEGFHVDVADTTGAGDAFLSAMLFGAIRSAGGLSLASAIRRCGPADWKGILDFANAAGALCASRKGAIPALPRLYEVEALLDGRGGNATR
ncbi:MAG TPA: PfkB family carbohydrate kinase [Bacillota bacterium]|nr:PfkB family carbohydrate kinase [Bacillota bacterium]